MMCILLACSVFVSGKADNLDELIDEANMNKLMLDSNGALLVLEGTFVTPGPEFAPIANTRLKVYCQHGDEVNKIFVVKTDEMGHFFEYKLNMQSWKCDEGDKAWGEYDKGAKLSADYTIVPKKYKNVNYIGNGEVNGVPEFSTITLALAVLGVTIGIVAIRRKD
jgi:hypothetical protein